jgi:hypothetical protein
MALVLRGKISACPLTRLRNLPEWLGPVKARAYRQASRFANSRRAGYPVHDYSELAASRYILLSAPPDKVAPTVTEMADAGVNWRRKRVVLCSGDGCDSGRRELEQRGAKAAALSLFDEAPRMWFLVEGEPPVVQAIRRLVEGGGGRITEVARGSLSICEAAISFASWLLMPPIEGSARSFRLAGLPPGHAAPLVERLVERSLRAYLKGGRRAWKPPRDEEGQKEFLRQLTAMCDADPQLAESLEQMAKISLSRAGLACDWIGTKPPRAKAASVAV